MTVKGLLLRFFLSYFMLLSLGGLIIDYFNIEAGSWVNISILIGLVYWICISFGKKNKRYFTKGEKRATILGIITIDMLLQFIVGLVYIYGTNTKLNISVLVSIVSSIGLFHMLIVYYLVSSIKKILIKQNVIINE